MNLFCIFKSSLTASDSKWCDSNVLIHHNPLVNHLTNNTAKHATSSNHLHFFPSMLPRHTHFSHLTRILALNFLKFSIHPSISPSSPRIKRHCLHTSSAPWHHPLPKPTDAFTGRALRGAGHRNRPLWARWRNSQQTSNGNNWGFYGLSKGPTGSKKRIWNNKIDEYVVTIG